MQKKRVLVTRNLPGAALEALKARTEVVLNEEDRVLTREELLALSAGMDGILCLLTDTIDAAVMEAAGPQLVVVSNYAVGYNNIDVTEATRRGIMVTNTPGVLTEATADMAWALLFAAARRVVEAMCYQVAKEIGGMAAVLAGEVDRIVLTGGMAFSSLVTGAISLKVSFIAPVVVVPGEEEMEALALGALRVLQGREEAKIYGDAGGCGQ